MLSSTEKTTKDLVDCVTSDKSTTSTNAKDGANKSPLTSSKKSTKFRTELVLKTKYAPSTMISIVCSDNSITGRSESKSSEEMTIALLRMLKCTMHREGKFQDLEDIVTLEQPKICLELKIYTNERYPSHLKGLQHRYASV